VGIVFRGFILTKHKFKKLPKDIGGLNGEHQDLRGAFISAIKSFADTVFLNTSLEYLESGNILFVFKVSEVEPIESNIKEQVILYGLLDKKKKMDRLVKKFLDKSQPIIALFCHKFNKTDFTELNQFESFKGEIPKFFEK
jgi:hypothetical protein